MRNGVTVVLYLTLSLMNNFNKTEATDFPNADYASWEFSHCLWLM